MYFCVYFTLYQTSETWQYLFEFLHVFVMREWWFESVKFEIFYVRSCTRKKFWYYVISDFFYARQFDWKWLIWDQIGVCERMIWCCWFDSTRSDFVVVSQKVWTFLLKKTGTCNRKRGICWCETKIYQGLFL